LKNGRYYRAVTCCQSGRVDEGPQEDEIVLTEEEKLEKQNEERNVFVEVVVPGDDENYPVTACL